MRCRRSVSSYGARGRLSSRRCAPNSQQSRYTYTVPATHCPTQAPLSARLTHDDANPSLPPSLRSQARAERAWNESFSSWEAMKSEHEELKTELRTRRVGSEEAQPKPFGLTHTHAHSAHHRP